MSFCIVQKRITKSINSFAWFGWNNFESYFYLKHNVQKKWTQCWSLGNIKSYLPNPYVLWLHGYGLKTNVSKGFDVPREVFMAPVNLVLMKKV